MRQSKTILLVAVALVAALASLPAAAQAKDYKSIKFPKLQDFEIAKPEIYTLDNGLKIFLMEDHELPLITVSMRFRTGNNFDPAEKTGLGDLVGQVQREGGTKSMSGDEMDEFLALRAATIETGMGGDVGFASMNCLSENFDEIFRVFTDVVRNPIFAEDKLGVAKTQTNSVISRRNDDISGITGREFNRLIYGADSPLGALTEYATVAAITRDDLVAWHKKYYQPNNAYLGVTGDFNSREMKLWIEAAFSDWPKGAVFSEPEVAYKKEMKPGIYFIEKEDVTQAYVRMGHLGMKVEDVPDYYAVQVMNEVLGGSFASRLFSTVRSKKGLAYSVFGGVGSAFMRPGVFQVGLSTGLDTMAKSVEALKEEVNGIINNPPSQAELERAKESILNSFVFRYDSREDILDQLMLYDYYFLPPDFLDTYQEKIEKVTTEDVARVAKQYIHPDKMALLVVGKSEGFDEPVSAFGSVAALDISIPPPPDTQPGIQRTAENLAAGTALFAKAVETITQSVAEKLDSLKIDATIAVSLGGQKMSLGQETAMLLPDKVRQTIKTPMGEQIIVLNGTKGFMSAGGQSQPMPESMIEEQFKDLGRDLLVLSNNLGNPELEAVAAGSDEVDGTPCQIVAVAFMGAESRLCVADDGTVIRQTYQGKHPMQQTPGLMEVRYLDYSEESGRLIPHTQVMTFEGEELATVTLNSIELNPELDQAIFEMPN